jgi:hypothetical protein
LHTPLAKPDFKGSAFPHFRNRISAIKVYKSNSKNKKHATAEIAQIPKAPYFLLFILAYFQNRLFSAL